MSEQMRRRLLALPPSQAIAEIMAMPERERAAFSDILADMQSQDARQQGALTTLAGGVPSDIDQLRATDENRLDLNRDGNIAPEERRLYQQARRDLEAAGGEVNVPNILRQAYQANPNLLPPPQEQQANAPNVNLPAGVNDFRSTDETRLDLNRDGNIGPEERRLYQQARRDLEAAGGEVNVPNILRQAYQNNPELAPVASQNSDQPRFGLSGALNTLDNTFQAGAGALQQGANAAMGALQGTRGGVLEQTDIARGDIENALGASTNAINQNTAAAQRAISAGMDIAGDQTNRGLNVLGATAGQVGETFTNALAGAERSFDQARSDVRGSIGQGRAAVTQNRDLGLAELLSGANQARDDLRPFLAGGQEAADLSAALSGALGGEAQQAAMSTTLNSPEFDFIREQGLRAVNANAAATGGTQGGEVLRDLNRFGQGLSSQRFDTAFGRLTGIANRGLGVAANMANISNQYGQNANQTFANAGNTIAGLSQSQSAALAGIGQSQAGLTGQLGAQQANAFQNIGAQGGNMLQNLGNTQAGLASQGAGIQSGAGQALSGLAQNAGSNLANISQNTASTLAGLGGQYANIAERTGSNIASLAQNTGGAAAGYQIGAGRDLAAALSGQATNQANLVGGQGAGVQAGIDQVGANIANALGQSGAGQAGDITNLAQLLQAASAGTAAQGVNAIGQAGNTRANAALAQGGAISNLANQLAGAFAFTGGFGARPRPAAGL